MNKYIEFNGIKFYKKKNTNYFYSNDESLKPRALHREIWKHHHKKEIPSGYVIHHIDHNPYNNDIDNLQLVSQPQHSKIHALHDKNDMKYQQKCLNNKKFGLKITNCLDCCKVLFTYAKFKAKKYCNDVCRGRFLRKNRKILNLNCIICQKEFKIIERLCKKEQRITCSRTCTNKKIKIEKEFDHGRFAR